MTLMVHIDFLPEVRALVDKQGNVIAYRLGGTRFPVFAGQAEADVFYRAIVPGLKQRAEKIAIELQEAHVKDDLIETIVHESLHVALDKVDVPGTSGEEAVVDKISREVMEDVRELPRISARLPEESRQLRQAYLRGEFKEVRLRRRPVRVRAYRRERK